MNKIGLYFETPSVNQAVYESIKSANDVLSRNRNFDVTLFYSNVSMPFLQPNFAMAHANAAWKFNGSLFATNIKDAIFLTKLPSAKRKIFYAYDLEWHGHGAIPYTVCLDIYRNPQLEIWVRNKDHAKAIESCFNRKINGILESFNLEEFYAKGI